MQASTENVTSSRPMIVTTTENIPDTRVVKTIGQVFGLTVRSRSLGGNIAAGLKSLVGGEIGSYVKLNEDARRQALDRMVQNAAAMGANAVTMMRFDSTEMGRSMSEIVAYGTARVVEMAADAPDPSARRAERAAMSVVEWVILAVVVLGVVIALFGWDRYRGNRKSAGEAAAPSPRARCSLTQRLVSGCACGTTRRPASGNTAPSEPRPVSMRAVATMPVFADLPVARKGEVR